MFPEELVKQELLRQFLSQPANILVQVILSANQGTSQLLYVLDLFQNMICFYCMINRASWNCALEADSH